MDLIVLNTNLEKTSILDVFESLIWTDRYLGYGEFEVYAKASKELLDILKDDYYLVSNDSEHVMIVEDSKIDGDGNSDNLIVTGRSLESILDRRIIWNQTVLTGSLQNGIQKLLNESIIAPTISDRAIPNFIFEASDDSNIINLTVETQFDMGANLYEAIKNLCLASNIGFKITLSDTNQFVFKLYSGVDRSYDQLQNPYVIFSPKFENIISSSYYHSKKSLKNVTFVMGEEIDDIGLTRKSTIIGSASSIERREIYTDASNISQTTDEEYMSDEAYLSQLSQKGVETLANNVVSKSFDGQVDTTRSFKYGEDFYMGDTVQLITDYGIEGKAMVSEMIHSQSTQETVAYPKFEMIN